MRTLTWPQLDEQVSRLAQVLLDEGVGPGDVVGIQLPNTVEGPDLTADDVLLNPFPMVNMAGINGMFLPWLRVGGLLVQHHPFDLPTFLAQIERYRATYT